MYSTVFKNGFYCFWNHLYCNFLQKDSQQLLQNVPVQTKSTMRLQQLKDSNPWRWVVGFRTVNKNNVYRMILDVKCFNNETMKD